RAAGRWSRPDARRQLRLLQAQVPEGRPGAGHGQRPVRVADGDAQRAEDVVCAGGGGEFYLHDQHDGGDDEQHDHDDINHDEHNDEYHEYDDVVHMRLSADSFVQWNVSAGTAMLRVRFRTSGDVRVSYGTTSMRKCSCTGLQRELPW